MTFIVYPSLNHLFIEGKGKSLPEEYSIPGNVAKDVIDDIVKWIGNLYFIYFFILERVLKLHKW